MKKIYSLVLFLIFISFTAQKKKQDYSFYENKGQIVDQNGNPNSDVKYLFNSAGLNVQIRENGFSYDVYEVERKAQERKANNESLKKPLNRRFVKSDSKFKYHRVDIDFLDSKSDPEIVAEEKSKDYDNFYNLPHKKEGVSFVHRYKKIIYKNLYNKIDLVFFKPADSTKPVEYNFIVYPGGRISDIKMKFNGAKTKLKGGKLSMNLRFGEMQENIPNSWIENDSKQNITVNFKDLGNQIFGFESDINTSDKTIVIDPTPTRIWGSYFGGSGDDYCYIKPDRNNNIFLYGSSSSKNNIATNGSYQSVSMGTWDAFVNKITKDGQKLWGTYYGDKYFDDAGGVDFDNSDNVYVGITMQTPNPSYPGNYYYYSPKIILLKLKANGTFEYQTIIGKDLPRYVFLGYWSEDNLIYDLVFKNNNVFIIGDTELPDLGTAGAFQETSKFRTGYVCQFNSNNGNLNWFTYASAISGGTTLNSIFNADNNGVEIIGTTGAKDFPMINAFQSVNLGEGSGGNNGIYLNFATNGSLLKSSYVGGKNSYYFETAKRIGSDLFFGAREYSRNAFSYFRVDTNSNTVKTSKEIFTHTNMGNTYIDSSGNIFISGFACPNDGGLTTITTPDAYQPILGKYCQAYFLKYDSNYNKIWGTFYGGNGGSQLGMIIKDYNDDLYLYGLSTGSNSGISTPGTFQQTGYPTTDDYFIAKFKDCSSFAQLYSNSPICVGKSIQLGANGGASYLWTGPNGFNSTLQNPIIPNATPADAGTYTCTVTGTGGCDTTATINIVIGDTIKPIPDNPNLSKITGDCNTVISTIPTATDNCKGKITASTSDPLSYSLPGNYTITWKYDDGNGNTETQTQQVEIIQQPLPIANPIQTFCKINQPKISHIVVTATNPKWYDASGNSISASGLLVNNTKYYVTQNSNGCESAKKEILVMLSDPNPPSGNAIQDFCSAANPTLKNMTVTGSNIKWYNNLGIQIPDNTPLQNGVTYFASQIVNGCESTNKLAIKANVVSNYLSANDFTDAFCNDTTNNFKTITIEDYKKDLISNPQNYTFEFRNASGQLISGKTNLNVGSNNYDVKIISALGCYQFVKLSLTLYPKPIVNLPKELEFCDSQGVNIDAGFDPNFTYQWNSGETNSSIIANQEKTYSVTVTNQLGCQNSASVIVKKAKLASIQNLLITNNNITVVMSAAGDYLYSLDNIAWQTSNQFLNLENGNHTVYVKTSLNCALGSKSFSIFSLSNIFSPNNDGVNDSWKISGIENYPNSEIRIVDKNGKLVLDSITKGEVFEWNGSLNGHKLPSDSYWYQIRIPDGRILEGYVVIKNRD